MSTDRRVRLLIEGRVQGVFYRQSALEHATALKLRGWVRNLDSGEVEALAEGVAPAVADFIVWCQKGPPQAQVTHVHVEDQTIDTPLSPFMVRRS